MDKTWVIYRHINNINGKSYIGQTCQNPPNDRWRDGKHYTGHFQQAILKYGWDNFSHEILEKDITTKKQADEREKYWIEFYDSLNNGYNLTPGGDSGNGQYKPVLQIDLNTHSIIKRYDSKEEAEKNIGVKNLSQACSLSSNQKTSKGFLWCYEEDYKQDLFNDFTFKITNSRSVFQISPIDFSIVAKYESISEAARSINKTPRAIQRCCNNNGYTSASYYWCYVDEYYPGWHPSNNNAHGRPIYNLTNNKTYINLEEAMEDTKLSRTVIQNRCERRSHNVDIKLCFLSDKDKYIQEENEKNAK